MTDTITFKQFDPEPLDGPCTVTFTWSRDPSDDGERTVVVELGDGDYPAIIAQVRSSGGIYAPSDSDTIVFLPWPPLYVEVDPH